MAEIVWTTTAQQRLLDIYEYVYLDSEYYADKLVKNIYESAQQLAKYPEIGSIIATKNNLTVRRLLFKRYKVVYVYYEEKVFIVSVVHQAQLMKLDFKEIIKLIEEA